MSKDFQDLYSTESVLIGELRPDLQRPETLVDIFDTMAETHPDRVAVHFGQVSISYRTLATASKLIAAHLIASAIKPGDYVGLWCARGPLVVAAMIGIMRAGAAYVPFDRSTPFVRISEACTDADIRLVIHDAITAPYAANLPSKLLEIDSNIFSSYNLGDFVPVAVHPDQLAYIIFTSGSTGRPKGVMISHRQACHWLRAESTVLNIQKDDIVYQGFSPAFDMSLEEIWTSLLVGAQLVQADENTARDPHEIYSLLNKHGVTILHAVPSLAALIKPNIPSLRLLNLGGEACTLATIQHWEREGLRIVNTYGPTEATVSCTLSELSPDRPITIGNPLPNYRIYIVDAEGKLAKKGEVGELWIGGPGVANGYIAQSELTQERFSHDPFSPQPGRVYRTGDEAIIGPTNEILFLGRRDGQVKIRGYRVELEEIEKALSDLSSVLLAGVAVQTNRTGDNELIAVLVPTAGHTIRLEGVRAHLKQRLPPYMIPSLFRISDDLPRLQSGKVDRQTLTSSTVGITLVEATVDNTISPLERRLIEALSGVIGRDVINPTMDFFEDLGAHSLMMARFVSKLRQSSDLVRLSMRDVYATRSIRSLAALIESRINHSSESATTQAATTTTDTPPSSVDHRRYYVCGVAQAISLFLIYGVLASALVTPYFAYALADEWTTDFTLSCLSCLATATVMPALMFSLIIVAKWLIIGRYKAGDYPLWGRYYFRCWLVERLLDLIPIDLLSNSPLYSHALRLLGATIGHNVDLGTIHIGAFDLLTIGDGSSLGSGTLINNRTYDGKMMRLRPVVCGSNVYIGACTVLNGGVHIGDHAEIQDMAQIAPDTIVPQLEIWSGSPAIKVGHSVNFAPLPRRRPMLEQIALIGVYLILGAALAVCSVAPILPVLYALNELDAAAPDGNFNYLLLSPIFGLIYTLLFALIVVNVRWVLLGRVKTGTYDVQGLFFARKWFVDKLFELSLTVIYSFFSTLYVAPYYRLLGAKIGKRSEISTAINVTHDLLEIGDEAFIADAVVLGDSQIRHGQLTLQYTKLGRRCFAGNGSVIPNGSIMPNETLLGVLSLAPENRNLKLKPGTTWFGIPSQALPNREMFLNYPEDLTFKPTRMRWLGRLTIETLRILFPSTYLIASLTLMINAAFQIDESFNLFWAIICLPLLYMFMVAFPALAIIILLKRLLIGRYEAGTHPMWTSFVWFSEALTAIYEMLLVPLLFNFLRGTPFIAWAFRALGANIGRRTFIDTTDMTEFDLVTIGDGAVLSHQSSPQTHLFEDRVMKLGQVVIGAGAVIGALSILLPDTVVGDQCSIAPLSLVMKGEELPAGSLWTGSPAEPF